MTNKILKPIPENLRSIAATTLAEYYIEDSEGRVFDGSQFLDSMRQQILEFGRWGTCGFCPTDESGLPKINECINTQRYDHWLGVELFNSLNTLS